MGWNALELMDESDYRSRLVGGILFNTPEEADAFDRGWRVNEYRVTREYGGPEEGGWWYTLHVPTGTSIVLHDLASFEDARDVRDAQNAFASVSNACDNPRGIYSVIGGADVEWEVEKGEPATKPECTPHYE